MSDAPETGLMTDHAGKPSSARAVSMLAAVTLCGLAATSAAGWAAPPPAELLWSVAAVAVGPQWLKGVFERGRQ